MKVLTPFRLGLSALVTYLISMIASTMLVAIVVSITDNIVITVITQILALLITYGGGYNRIWNEGSSDLNRVHYGHTHYDRWKGLKAGLVVMAPFFLFWLVFFICKIAHADILFVYKLINFNILILLNAMFGGAAVPMAELSYGSVFAALIPLLVFPLISTAAYQLGYRQVSFMEKLIYKNLPKRQPGTPKQKKK